jgi:membrane protease YdiL (CAAX protease family)
MQTTSSPTSSALSPARSVVALVSWLALAALQIGAGFAFAGGPGGDEELIYDYQLALSVPIVYGALIGLTFAIATAYPDPVRALGLRRFERRWLWMAFAVILLALVVGAIVEALFHGNASDEQGVLPESWRPDRLPALVLNGVVTVTLVPFAEELFFRGLGVRALGVLGGAVAVVATALAFALAHAIVVALPGLFVFAAGLAWVRLRSASVWPGVVAHGVYNALVLALAVASLL